MTKPLTLHPDLLLAAEPSKRKLARELYEMIAGMPIIKPLLLPGQVQPTTGGQ